MTPEEYRELAIAGVESLLRREYAVVWSEVEAKLADQQAPDLPTKIDAHHLSTAKQRMLADGELQVTAEATRGGRVLDAYHLTGAPKRAVETAAARKRLLHARFMGWAKGTKRHPRGLIGGAGEAVTDASLRAAAPSGYRLCPRENGEVRHLFGAELVGGPLDNAAHLLVVEDDLPRGIVTVPIEVKNIREWLYPNSAEIYQLLAKAAHLQVLHPQERILPVLVCRRAHKTLFVMAKQLGFYVVDAHRQFIAPSADVTDTKLLEVKSELGFADLIVHDGPHEWVVGHFSKSLPKNAWTFSERWAQMAPTMAETFSTLRMTGMDHRSRKAILNGLKAEIQRIGGYERMPW